MMSSYIHYCSRVLPGVYLLLCSCARNLLLRLVKIERVMTQSKIATGQYIIFSSFHSISRLIIVLWKLIRNIDCFALSLMAVVMIWNYLQISNFVGFIEKCMHFFIWQFCHYNWLFCLKVIHHQSHCHIFVHCRILIGIENKINNWTVAWVHFYRFRFQIFKMNVESLNYH